VPGVVHTRCCLCADALACTLCDNTRSYFQNVLFVSLTGNFRATGATIGTTDTFGRGDLIGSVGKDKASGAELQIFICGPSESCALLRASTQVLAQVWVGNRLHDIHDVGGEPGDVLLETASADTSDGEEGEQDQPWNHIHNVR